MFSLEPPSSLKRSYFFADTEENTEINDGEKRTKKKKRSPVGVDELYACDSPTNVLREDQNIDLPIFDGEHGNSTDDLEGCFERSSSSSNSLEVFLPLAKHKAVFFDMDDSERNIGSLPCSSYVYNQVYSYSQRLEQKIMFLKADIYQELKVFLSAIQQNVFLESDDLVLMEFFNCIEVFFEMYIDPLRSNMESLELHDDRIYSDLEHLKQKLNDLVMIGCPLEERDFCISKFS